MNEETHKQLMSLENRVAALEKRLAEFTPVVVMLRLEDRQVHPVILFAKVAAIPEQPASPFTVVT